MSTSTTTPPAAPPDDRLPGGGRRRIPVAVIAVVAVVVTVTLVGGAAAVVLREETGDCPAALEQLVAVDTRPRGVATLMVELASNAERPISTVTDDLAVDVRSALDRGAAIELVIDAGSEQPLISSDCLDGTRLFAIDRANTTREAQDRAAAEAAVIAAIAGELGRASAAPKGSALRLLQRGADLPAGSGSTVVVWTDMLGNADDCLDVTDAPVDTAAIEAIVTGCEGEIDRYRRPVTIVGAGTTDRSTGRERWAVDLAARLCTDIADDCEARS